MEERSGCAIAWPAKSKRVISECGEDAPVRFCAETLAMFASAYGAEAGNVALKLLAIGGIYLARHRTKILKTSKMESSSRPFWIKDACLAAANHPCPHHSGRTCALLGSSAFAEARVQS